MLALAAASLASALQAGTVEVCVRGATGLPATDSSLLRNPDPDPFVVVTLEGVSDPADECRRVGLLKGEPMRRTARDGSGCCRSAKEHNNRHPAWSTFCCYFPQEPGSRLSLSVWDDGVLYDELIGTAEVAATGGASTLRLRGSKCDGTGSRCAVHVDVTPVLLPSAQRLGANASAATRVDEPGTLSVGDVEVCVLDVHGHGLPAMDSLTSADWAVVARLGYDETHRCAASLYDSTLNDIAVSSARSSAYWTHCCHTFRDVVATASTALHLELYDSDSYFHDELCCTASVPLFGPAGPFTGGPFTVALSGGTGRYLDAKLTFVRPPSPPPPTLPPPPPAPPIPPPTPAHPPAPKPPEGCAAEVGITLLPPLAGAGGAHAALAAAAAVPPKPDGCYLVGPPAWGPAPPECMYGALLEVLAGKETIGLPDAHLFPPAGTPNLVDVQLPLSGHVTIHAITLSRISCSYIVRDPIRADTSSARGAASSTGADTVAVALHVREATCVASVHADGATGLFTSYLRNADATFVLTDVHFATNLSLAFQTAHNGSTLLGRTGFLDPSCRRDGSASVLWPFGSPHACRCDGFDEACRWAHLSIGGIEMHLFGATASDGSTALNEIVRAVEPILRASAVDSTHRLLLPRTTTVARRPPRAEPKPAAERSAGAPVCPSGDRCRLANLVLSRMLGAGGPFSLPRMLAAVGSLLPAAHDRPTAAILRLSGSDLAAMATAVLGPNPLSRPGVGVAVRAGQASGAGVLRLELIGLNLTLGARSLVDVGVGSELSALLAFDYLDLRAAVRAVWTPRRAPHSWASPGLRPPADPAAPPGGDADLDSARAISQTFQFGFRGRELIAQTQTSALPLSQGASALVCALYELGVAQFDLSGEALLDATAVSGGAWPADVVAAFNAVSGMYLRAANGLSSAPGGAFGETSRTSVAEAVGGSILPIVIRNTLATAARCAERRPCPYAEGAGEAGIAPVGAGTVVDSAAAGSSTVGAPEGGGAIDDARTPPDGGRAGASGAGSSAPPAAPSGSWMRWVGIAHAFAALVNAGLRAADVVKLQPILLDLGGRPLRLRPTGSLLHGARWASDTGAAATFALLPNVTEPSVVLREVVGKTQLNPEGTSLLVTAGDDQAVIVLDHLDLSATLTLQLPAPSSHGELGRRAATGDGTITTSVRLRLTNVQLSLPLLFFPANGSAAAVRRGRGTEASAARPTGSAAAADGAEGGAVGHSAAEGGAVRPWMLTLGDLLGGVSCVHARVTGDAPRGGEPPSLAGTVEALELHEGSTIHGEALAQPIGLRVVPAWRPWLAAEINKALAAAEAEEPPCDGGGSGPARVLLATPLWLPLALVLALVLALSLYMLFRLACRLGGYLTRAPRATAIARQAML